MLALLPAARADKPINFQEVFDLIRTNSTGLKESDLSHAAALGLIQQLAPRVSLVEAPAPGPQKAATFSSAILDGAYGYVRIGEIVDGIDKRFSEAFERLRSTNRLRGLILDLRFSSGRDYPAALALADQFFGSEQPLVDWGEGLRKSTDKSNAVSVPVAVLVNQKTSGAAEVVAGILRSTDLALLIGTNTAGQASVAREFTLNSGQRLRLAVAPVKVADGKELPLTGLRADIQVDVNPEDERAWYEDAYKVLNKPGRLAGNSTNETNLTVTNRPSRRRLNEAELVRMNREGVAPEPELPGPPGRSGDSTPPVVNDPVLARALDLLKGIAVVSRFRPS
jgi:carboxyl-terminal processing protease